MNPPFSASPNVEGRFAEAAMRHVGSALARLAEGGRLVAITGHNVGPDQPAWREAFVRLQEKGRVVFTATIAGQAYARHGTTIETRLTVIDRVPAEDPRAFPSSPGMAADAAELLDRVSRLVPPRAAGDRRDPPARPSRFPAPHVDRTAAESSYAAAHARQPPGPSPGLRRTRLRDLRMDARRFRTSDREPLRRLCAAIDPDPGRAAAPDQARAVGRDGRGRPSPPLLPALSAAATALRRHPVRRAARERHLCRRSPCRPSRRLLHRRRDLRSRLGRPGRRRRRGALPARLVSRRRHRRRQGPPGRRDHSRQLAQGAAAAARLCGSRNPTN